MIYNILTPLRRYENIERLYWMLYEQRRESSIDWHIIMDEDAPFHLFFREPWIHVTRYENTKLEFWEKCNFILNRWLETHTLNPLFRYCILNDDDAYEDGFFKKLDLIIESSDDIWKYGLLIVSMKRGDQTPPGVTPTRAHATNTLVAAPENMRVGHVGVEQFVVCGKYLEGARLPLSVAGDGELVQWLVANFPAVYAPEAFVLFNYYESGRWNK